MNVPEDRIVPIVGGTVNLAFRIEQGGDDPLIMRLAPSDAEAAAGPSWLTSHGLRREQTTIRLLKHMEPILPRTLYFDDSRQWIDRDWVLQTWVEGDIWQEVRSNLTDAEDMQLWRDLGSLTRSIHATISEEFGPPEAGLGYATWADLVRWDVTGFSVDARRFDIDYDQFDRLTTIVDRAVPILNRVTEARLVHSDLSQRHVFIARDQDGRARITGVIDFEFARFADPYSESVFIDEALLPSNDGRDVALCEGYRCDRPTHDGHVRRNIYTAIGMGWLVTNMVRRSRPKQIPSMLTRLKSVLDYTEDLL